MLRRVRFRRRGCTACQSHRPFQPGRVPQGPGNHGGGGIQPAFVSLPAKEEPVHGKPVLPADAHGGNYAELAKVASLRGLSLAGLTLASGTRVAPLWAGVRLAVLDCDRLRPLPGASPARGWLALPRLWQAGGAEGAHHQGQRAKLARGFAGSRRVALRPIGGRRAGFAGRVPLHSGFQTSKRDCPGCHAGSGERLSADALAMLAGKRVRIYPHADAAGEAAAALWTRQLADAGAGTADAFASMRCGVATAAW